LARNHPRPAGLFLFLHRASRPAQVGPSSQPSRPSTSSPPFSFAPVADRWGPAVRPFPNLQSGQPRPPLAPPAVTGRFPRAPRLQAPYLSGNEASPSLPLFNRHLPVLILPSLNPPSRPVAVNGHAAGEPPPRAPPGPI
jgi:hypothetical protein